MWNGQRNVAWVGLCVWLACMLAARGDEPAKGRGKARAGEKWALLIGVDDYANAQRRGVARRGPGRSGPC